MSKKDIGRSPHPPTAAQLGLMHGFPPPLDKRVTIDNWQEPPFSRWSFQHIRQLLPTAAFHRGRAIAPLDDDEDPQKLADLSFRDAAGQPMTLQDLLAETYTDGFLVLHQGRVVTEQYFNGMTSQSHHLIWSCSKSIVGTLAGVLVYRGQLDPDALVSQYIPEIRDTGYGDATIRHLLDMRVDLDYEEDYDPQSGIANVRQADRAAGYSLPRSPVEYSSYDYLLTLKQRGKSGQLFRYTTVTAELLGWVLQRAAHLSLPELLSRELWTKLGAEQDGYTIVDRLGNAAAGGGFCVTLRDLARFGQMIVQQGWFNDEQVIPTGWIHDILMGGDRRAFAASEDGRGYPANSSYRSFWWVIGGAKPALMAIGIHGQHLYLVPDQALVIVKFSSQPTPFDEQFYFNTYRGFWAIASAL